MRREITSCLLFLTISIGVAWAQQPRMGPIQLAMDGLTADKTSGSLPFEIGEADQIDFKVTATVGGLVVSVATPSGQVVTADNAEELGGEFATADLSKGGGAMLMASPRGHLTMYTLPSFGPGIYTVRYEASAPIEETVAVVVEAMPSVGRNRMFEVSPYQALLGAPMAFRARLVDRDQPLEDASVDVTVTGPGGESALRLSAESIGAEYPETDDLLYGLFLPTVAGEHTAKATIRGTRSNGEELVKQETTTFEVVESVARWTGHVVDEGVDHNDDSLLDEIKIEAGIEVEVGGDYRATLTLSGARGERVTAMDDRLLQSDDQAVRFSLNADELAPLGDGPYSIDSVELELRGVDGLNLAHRIEDLGQTRSYARSQFRRPF